MTVNNEMNRNPAAPAYTAPQASPAQNAYARRAAGAQHSFNVPGMESLAEKARGTGYSIPTLIGIGLAVVGTVFGVIGLLGSIMLADSSFPFLGLFMLGVLIGLPSYVFAGGLGHALKSAWKVAKTAWFIIPIFPVDLICGVIGLVAGFMLFTAVPIVFVLKSVHEKYGR